MLESPVNMVELTVAQNENGKPLIMPEVGQHNVVVCGMTYVNGVEQLMICESLYEMENEYAYSTVFSVTITRVCWYVADRQECEVALSGMVANAV